jgi:hypothetical protein
VGSTEEECAVGAVSALVEARGETGSAGVPAIAEDVGDLTTKARAETTNGAKLDEEHNRVQKSRVIEVTAVFAEVSRLDTAQTEPSFDNSAHAGESSDSTIGMTNLQGATRGGCSPTAAMHPP